MKLVLINGEAYSGKDTAAQPLRESGFTRFGYADKLKEILAQILEMMGAGSAADILDILHDPQRKEEVICNAHGSPIEFLIDGDVIHRTYRQAAQIFGTECMRIPFHEDIWVEPLKRLVDKNIDVVVTDFRFPNEYYVIRDYALDLSPENKIVTVRVERENKKVMEQQASSHHSESALRNFVFDHVIKNDGTVEDLHRKIKEIV